MIDLWAFLKKLGNREPEGIHYIGGSDVLPPPLKGEAEQHALEALEQGDEGARQQLVEHNLRLVVYIARRFENTGTHHAVIGFLPKNIVIIADLHHPVALPEEELTQRLFLFVGSRGIERCLQDLI